MASSASTSAAVDADMAPVVEDSGNAGRHNTAARRSIPRPHPRTIAKDSATSHGRANLARGLRRRRDMLFQDELEMYGSRSDAGKDDGGGVQMSEIPASAGDEPEELDQLLLMAKCSVPAFLCCSPA